MLSYHAFVSAEGDWHDESPDVDNHYWMLATTRDGIDELEYTHFL
jgi:hypothetical protein